MLASTMRTLERSRRVRPNALTQAGSISTPATARARLASSTVSAPRPGPTSTMRSVGASSRASTICSSCRRSARKFCPQRRWYRTPKRRATPRITEGSARSRGRLLAGVVQPKEVGGVSAGRFADLRYGRAAKARDAFHGLDEVARGIGLPAPALRRKKRRVGFHQHVVKRDDTGGPDHPVRGGIGHGPGERDVETSGQCFGGESRVAAEAVKDAADSRKLVEDGEQVREGIASVQDDRLVHLERQAKHLAKDLLLLAGGDAMVVGEVIVQPDFPYCDYTGMTGELAQLPALGGVDRISGGVWMPTDGCREPRDPLRQRHARPVVGGVVADIHHGVDTDGPRLLQRLLRRNALAQVQEMGVRIDQATGSGFSIRGKRTPPSAVWVRGASLPHSRAVVQEAFGSALICVAILVAVSGRKGEIKYDVSRIASTRLYITVCSRLR